jgi:hypothetical protein
LFGRACIAAQVKDIQMENLMAAGLANVVGAGEWSDKR